MESCSSPGTARIALAQAIVAPSPSGDSTTLLSTCVLDSIITNPEQLKWKEHSRRNQEDRAPRALRFSGHELMEKLAVLVPMPRANLVRYHGVLAPAARWRRHVLPQADAEGRVCGHRPRGGRVPKRRVSWAQLLKRVFIEDVLRCRGCGGPRRLLAEVTDPDAVLAILTHLGIDPNTEGSAGVRGPPSRTLRTAS